MIGTGKKLCFSEAVCESKKKSWHVYMNDKLFKKPL